MTHNFSIRCGSTGPGAENVFDIPGLGLTTLEMWLGKTFRLPDGRTGECVSVRSYTLNVEAHQFPSVDLGLRMDGGTLTFASIASVQRVRP